MRMRRKKYIYAGIIWTLLFAGMSFYWAAGGMIGIRSLGGEIYQKALYRDQGLVPIVWATGIIKVIGAFFLLILLRERTSKKFEKWVSILCIAAGIFMILYGAMNFITISLAGLNILDFELEAYAMGWRLIFWEPFWVLGGLLYVLAGKKDKMLVEIESTSSK